jgi:hypothetical protein
MGIVSEGKQSGGSRAIGKVSESPHRDCMQTLSMRREQEVDVGTNVQDNRRNRRIMGIIFDVNVRKASLVFTEEVQYVP